MGLCPFGYWSPFMAWRRFKRTTLAMLLMPSTEVLLYACAYQWDERERRRKGGENG